MQTRVRNWAKSLAATGGILFFFIMAFEVLIMISPFAFFFYSVFNPVFAWLNSYTATRWLTAFFLPHMILPPTLPLKVIRVLGSVFFVAGSLIFIICALQVYAGKIFKWGLADKGLYRYIRHPQYLALGVWGAGMCILWPRFIVLASLSLMFVLYYFLAKDEERRMLARYGEGYRAYMQKTGMFLPALVGRRFLFVQKALPGTPVRYALIPVLIVSIVLAVGFILRGVTLSSLAFESRDNLTLVSILPEDDHLKTGVLDGILKANAVTGAQLLRSDRDYLGYVMPADYIMQGMIADTGDTFHLYKQHHTMAMITEWVLHPFSHLRASPALHMAKMHNVDPTFARRHHCPIGIDDPKLTCENCPYRRVVIVEVDSDSGSRLSGSKVLSFATTRTPVEVIDLNAETGQIVKEAQVKKSTAWENVPTPAI
jgi:protein-S-isoprenylcysteine O-methyltransferase Ste14